MANYEIVSPHVFTDALRKLTTEDRGHADTFNGLISPMINNDVYLKEHADLAGLHIADDEIHITEEERSSWNGKAGTAEATQSAKGLMAAEDKKKLDGIAAGADVNQNAFSKIKSGSNAIEANAKSSLLELVSGNKIQISVDNGTKKVTISLTEDGIEADTLDGKHAALSLNTQEKADLSGAINELLQLLSSHTNSGTIHVTSAEKSTWNGKAGTAEATQSAKGLMAAADKKKLDGIAAGANAYVHPSTHAASMITQDATHRFVTDTEKIGWTDKYTKSEVDNKLSQLETKIDWKESVATYADIATTYPNPQDGWTVNVMDTNYTYRYTGNSWIPISANAIPKSTASVDGLMTAADKKKLDGIAAGANAYVHPSTHAASMITQDATHRFVTDTEKIGWNSKAGTAEATQSAKGLMAAADKKKLDGIAAGANAYVHPSTHAASMITQDATHRFVTDTEKIGWNASQQNAINAIKALMTSQQINDNGKLPTSALIYAMQQTITAQQEAIATLNSNMNNVQSTTLWIGAVITRHGKTRIICFSSAQIPHKITLSAQDRPSVSATAACLTSGGGASIVAIDTAGVISFSNLSGAISSGTVFGEVVYEIG